MGTDDRTYIIEPGATDPDLIRSLTPLGEDPGQQPVRTGTRRRRRRSPEPTFETAPPPPRRPALWLLGVFALGPFALLVNAGARGRRWRLGFAAGATALAGASAWIWLLPPETLGGGDRAMLIQTLAVAVAAAAWLATWCAGLLLASRRIPEGPFSRRSERRPLAAGLAGLVAPGLGLFLAGRRIRCVITLAVVGTGAGAALALSRAAGWWSTHRSDPAPILTDLQLEQAFLALAALVIVGGVAWLVSALEAGRLAAGPRVVRAISGADRIPAALLLALVALGVCFRPLDAAQGLDRLTSKLVAEGLRFTPLQTARAAVLLAPADPVLELRVAERQEALGRRGEAAFIREQLQRRWQRYLASDQVLATRIKDAKPTPATAPAPTPTGWRPAAKATPPFSHPISAATELQPPPPAH